MDPTIASTTGTETAAAGTPAAAALPDPGRRSGTLHRLTRAVPLIELGAILVIEAIYWAGYTRRRLGWRAEGALARWEHELTRPMGDRATGGRPTRRR
jgi:hypothetical protein